MPLCHKVLPKISSNTPVLDFKKAFDMASTPATTTTSPETATTLNSSLSLPESIAQGLADMLNLTLYNTLPLGNGSSNDSVDASHINLVANNNNSLFIKIVLLLILTAVVLLSTYKFVVRLFSGYTEKKDDSSEYYIGIQDSY